MGLQLKFSVAQLFVSMWLDVIAVILLKLISDLSTENLGSILVQPKESIGIIGLSVSES